jgi:uncharacterized SAM-binding protein YcdF (DUF218 family)
VDLRNSYIHPLLNGGIILLLLWLLGLLFFARDVTDMAATPPVTSAPPRSADGIVVLTGGRDRVPVGLDLLLEGRAPLLLISGMGGTTAEESSVVAEKIIPENHPAHDKIACCITFGTYAEDTHGNAVETAAWAKKHTLRSLIIVTAHYHMRRALLEFSGALPGVALLPYGVNPDNVRLHHWWDWPGTARLLMEEYNKLLFAFLKAALRKIF